MTTQPEEDLQVRLDDAVLGRIASLICGDDSTTHYRTGPEIVRFFEAAQWRRVGLVEGGRRAWVLDKLIRNKHDSDAMRRILLRLADPREYLDAHDTRVEVVDQLNSVLAVEGLRVTYQGTRPVLVAHTPLLGRPLLATPLQLEAEIADIVSDARFGAQLQVRLDEARICRQYGAHLASIFMLGSLLEGVLYDVARTTVAGHREGDDNLERLITLAKDKGWFSQDLFEYTNVLRNHRNLVHPKKQFTQGHAPDGDIALIAWNVVVAALNDLAQVRRDSTP